LLQARAAPGSRALLLYPTGLEFIAAFFGCLYAGMVAIPAFPPDLGRAKRTLPRLRAITTDAQPQFALTESALLASVNDFLATEGVPHVPFQLATDQISDDLARAWQAPDICGGTLAFLQYTSGSTASPKGVMVSHGNLLANIGMISRAFALTEQSVCVGWLPLYHDLGLIGNVLGTLQAGGRCVLMAPPAFLQRPARWLEAISRYQAHISGGPDFAYDLCARKVSAEELTGLDLSSWRVAVNGAEPVRRETLANFAKVFGPRGFRSDAFYPCYGLAEATLLVTGGPFAGSTLRAERRSLEQNRVVVTDEGNVESRCLVGCGHSYAEEEIIIVDPQTLERCPTNQVGEIWVAGPHVAKGYWNRPDESAAVFQARLGGRGEGPFLRTGDLGFLKDGGLFVTGRLKDAIIVHGANHYPEDIEATVEQSHSALRSHAGAVFTQGAADETRLVVAHEVARDQEPLDFNEVIATIRRAVAEAHDLHVHEVLLLRAGTLPRTSSGKVQRHLCAAATQARTLHVVARGEFLEQERSALHGPAAAPSNDLERWLTGLWQEIMGLDQIGIHDNFFELGGSSVQAAMLANRLQLTLGAVVSPVAFFEAPTVAQLAEYLVDSYGPALIVCGLAPPNSRPAGTAGAATPRPLLDHDRFARLHQLLRPTVLSNGHPSRAKSSRAIFILAPPRSGTTLFRVMLGGHPQLFAPPELELLNFHTLKERRAFFGVGYEFWLQGTTRAVMEIKRWNALTAERFIRDREDAEMTVAEFYSLIQEWIGGRTLVDKSPSYALDLRVLNRAEELFEQPLYIHLLRHPGAAIRSFEEAKLELANDIRFTAGPDCSPIELAEFIWITCQQNILAFLQDIPAHRHFRVSFERLVREPRPVLEEVCNFLRLEFAPEMLQPYEEKQRRMTDGISEMMPMIGDPKFHRHETIDASAAHRWKKHRAHDLLGPKTWELAESIGYIREDLPRDLNPPPDSQPPLTSESPEALLARLDQLPDEQVESLLKTF
jgi:acyl-CoA synthetase (AMP-forming)/AMP-acid ligase II